MTRTTSVELGLRTGDHVCAFYSGTSGPAPADVAAPRVIDGLVAGQKCVCFVYDSGAVRDRVPSELVTRPTDLQFMDPDSAYLPDGEFSKEAHIRRLHLLARNALDEGYDQLRLLGDASFVANRAVDTKTWFAYEAEVNNFAPRYPQFLICLYDLDKFDGDLVMYVLQTHPRILLNSLVINNPYYVPPDELLGRL
jgi:hypothetical protein